MVGQAGGSAPIEEASFSHVPSQAAPHTRSSRKSVAGNALRILTSASQVGTTQLYMYAWLSCMMYNLVLGLKGTAAESLFISHVYTAMQVAGHMLSASHTLRFLTPEHCTSKAMVFV